VQLLSRPENSAHQTVRNHEVMLTVMLYIARPRGSIMPERVTVDACGAAARCGIKSGKVENALLPPERGIVTAEF
jgi:hypothetical protein